MVADLAPVFLVGTIMHPSPARGTEQIVLLVAAEYYVVVTSR